MLLRGAESRLPAGPAKLKPFTSSTAMNQAAQVIALLVVVIHLGVIFWPRKPLCDPVDENGLPLLWRNQGEDRRDVSCVWSETQSMAPALAVAARKSHHKVT